MTDHRLDLRDLPPAERHPEVLDRFEQLAAGETLTLVNDHDPKPLSYQMKEEVDGFDADGYSVDHVGEEEFVAELPKR